MRATYNSKGNRPIGQILTLFVLSVFSGAVGVMKLADLIRSVEHFLQDPSTSTVSADLLRPVTALALAYVAAVYFWRLVHWWPTGKLQIEANKTGLTYRHRGQDKTVNWSDIEQVFFLLLGHFKRTRWHAELLEAFVRGEKPASTQAYYRLQLSDGVRLTLGALTDEGAQFINGLWKQIVRQRRPRLLKAYQQGQPLDFGDLSLDIDGWRHGQKRLDWSDFVRAEIRFAGNLQGYFIIYYWGRNRRGRKRRRTWFKAPVSKIPNVFLLSSLVKVITQEKSAKNLYQAS